MARNNILIILVLVLLFIVMTRNSGYATTTPLITSVQKTQMNQILKTAPTNIRLIPSYNRLKTVFKILSNATVTTSSIPEPYRTEFQAVLANFQTSISLFIERYASYKTSPCDYITFLYKAIYNELMRLNMVVRNFNDPGMTQVSILSTITNKPLQAEYDLGCFY